MLTQDQVTNVMAKVAEGVGLRDALKDVAGKALTEDLRDWILENAHVDYLEAKRLATAKRSEVVTSG